LGGRLGAAGRRRAERLFDHRMQARALERLYDNALGRPAFVDVPRSRAARRARAALVG
jgi:hypothetical protein